MVVWFAKSLYSKKNYVVITRSARPFIGLFKSNTLDELTFGQGFSDIQAGTFWGGGMLIRVAEAIVDDLEIYFLGGMTLFLFLMGKRQKSVEELNDEQENVFLNSGGVVSGV
jgi:hypothetical protein